MGKVAGVLLLVIALYTGVLFRLINLFFLVLVFSPLFVGPYLRQKVGGRLALRTLGRC